MGWGIINGAKEGDKEEEVTFIGGRKEMVINYVLEDRMAWKRIERLEVGGEIDSNHCYVTIWLERAIKGERQEGERKEEKEGEMRKV